MKPLLVVRNRNNQITYVETKPPRDCTICKPIDPDFVGNCKAYEISQADLLAFKLPTRVYTDCLRNLQGWNEVERNG
jgi:hypothetical protein